jgi:hypothetical protein
MRFAGAIALVVLGIAMFPVPRRLAESGAAWVFATIAAACFFGAYKLFKAGIAGRRPPTSGEEK